MKPFDNLKVNTSLKKSKINNNTISNKKDSYRKNKQNINRANLLKSQAININKNINPTNRQKTNNNLEMIENNISSTLKSPPTNKYNFNFTNSKEKEKEKEEFENTKKYINYLKEHLNSSYYANNEINNKNLLLMEKSKSLNEEIKQNFILYEKLKKAINQRINQNNDYKNKYEKFLEQKRNESQDNKLNLEEKIKELKLQNLLINKENQSAEEILLNLKKTIEILEKKKLNKKKEKEDKIKELNEAKNDINKLKLNLEKITKDLYTKNIKLEEKKKSMIYIINYNDNNNNNINLNDKVPNELLYKEIDKMKTIIENQKLLLNKIKDNQNDIKEKINEQKNIINKNKNNDNNKYKELLIKEKRKNKELLMNLIKSNKEAKDLTTVHNQIKNKYEEEINKIKDEIEKLLKNKKIEKDNLDYNVVLNQLLEEQKNLKMFNKEFKDKLLIKKAIEDKIAFMEKENEKLKNKLNNSEPNNNIKYNNKINVEISENEEDKNENKENKEDEDNKIVPENQGEIKLNKKTSNKDSSIYTITDKGKLFIYNIPNKKFTTANTKSIENWDKFIKIFLLNYEGSLLLNTFKGLYILIGDLFSDLYYYSQENNEISKKITFNYSHKYGGMMISPDQQYLIVLGGCDTREVELLNLENNEIEELPNLLSDRINSSYSFIGDNLLYVFFGENNNTIEYLDLNDEKKEWKNVDYSNNEIEIDNIYGHISIPVNENEIIIVGGKNNHKMLMFNVKENVLEITDNKIPFLDTIKEYHFDKDKYYNTIINSDKKGDKNSIKQVICMDSQGNIHLFDNEFNYIVLLVDAHEI